jgi:hypothetical protein
MEALSRARQIDIASGSDAISGQAALVRLRRALLQTKGSEPYLSSTSTSSFSAFSSLQPLWSRRRHILRRRVEATSLHLTGFAVNMPDRSSTADSSNKEFLSQCKTGKRLRRHRRDVGAGSPTWGVVLAIIPVNCVRSQIKNRLVESGQQNDVFADGYRPLSGRSGGEMNQC